MIALTTGLCALSCRLTSTESLPVLEPGPLGDIRGHARLQAGIDRLIVSPAGTTVILCTTAEELESYVNGELLPRAGFPGLRVRIALTAETAAAEIALSERGPSVQAWFVSARSEQGSCMQLAYLSAGRLTASRAVIGLLNRVLTDTLSSGDTGIRVLDARLDEGSLCLAVSRR